MALKRRASEELESLPKAVRLLEKQPNQFYNTATGGQYNNTDSGKQLIAQNIHIHEHQTDRKPEYFECLKDLRITDPYDTKSRIEDTKGGLLAPSYEWILDNKDFKQWCNDQCSGLFWINGGPGKGKTMLLCGIIDKLNSKVVENGPPSFFFCQNDDSRLNKATAVLRGLTYLLATKRPLSLEHLQEEYNRAGGRLFDNPDDFYALSNIFRSMLLVPTTTPVYLVVDALDECQTDLRELLDLICQTSSISSTRVKWIVSSRNQIEIEEVLESVEHGVTLSLDQYNASASAAVDRFIEHKVSELTQKKKYTPRVQVAVRDYLRKHAGGTFLWVALVYQKLVHITSWKTLSELDAFPSGLQSLYESMMKQMFRSDDEDVEICTKILAVTMIVYEPITLRELPSLIELPEDISENAEWLKDIVKLCGSFLTIRKGTIYFVHQSAKEYLNEHAFAKIFPNTPGDVHYNVFSRSFRVVLQNLTRDIYKQQDPGLSICQIKRPDSDPLQAVRYPCVYWVEHLGEVERGRLQQQDDLKQGGIVHIFLRGFFLYWLEALSLIKRMSEGVVAVTKLETVLKNMPADSELLNLVKDARRFILHNGSLIENAPLQAYASALVFSPTNSLTRRSFKKDDPSWISANLIVEDDWSPCLQTLKGHDDSVRSVVFSPDYKYLASASSDRSIMIWDAATGQHMKSFEGHSNCVRSLTFSHDNKYLISTSSDRTIRLWDMLSTKCVQIFKGHTDWVRSVVFWHDTNRFISASSDRTIRVWNLQNGNCERILKGHSYWVNALAFPQGSNHQHLASASSDWTIRIWDMDMGSCVRTLEGHKDWVNALAFSHDSNHQFLASASSDRSIRIWDFHVGSCIQILEGHTDWVNSVIFSHDNKHIASASYDQSIRIWDTAGECRQILQGHSGPVNSLAFLDNNERLVSASNDGSLKIWDTTIFKHTQVLESHSNWVGWMIFSRNGKHLVSQSDDLTMRIWDTTTGECKQILAGHTESINSAVLLYDKLLASASSDRTIRFWDVTTGNCIRILKGHEDWVGTVVSSPNDQYLASASGDRTIRIWEVTTGVCVGILGGHDNLISSIAFSSDGKYIASASSDRTVRIWNALLQKCIQILDGHDDWVNSVVFSDDNKHLASTSGDRTIRIWDFHLGKCTRILQGHEGFVNSAIFSHDGKHLVSTSADRTVRIWDVATGKCVTSVDVAIPLNKISFDRVSSHILTEIGRIMLGPMPHVGMTPLEPTETNTPSAKERIWHGYGLSSDRSWITYDGQDVLQLPHEYRVMCSAVSGWMVAVGCIEGRVAILRFNPDKSPILKMRENHILEGTDDRQLELTSQDFLPGSAQTATVATAHDTASQLEPESLSIKVRRPEPAESAASDLDDRTPLHLAVLCGEESVVRQLLEDGEADSNAKDKSLRTALFYAMKLGHKNIALCLAQKWNVPDQVVIDNLDNPAEDYKARSLFSAIKRQNINEIGFLIEIGANMEAKGYGDWPGWMGTALHEAAWFGTPEILQLMLKNGANKDARDIGGRTPSQRPNWSRTLEISRLLS